MDNEAPNYASWMPEAGGYVANGKVVSKSPMYDEAGKLRLDVDASLFGGTAAQPTATTAKAQPQVANNPLSNNGITTANTTGSGEDVNSMETKLGSMGSLSLNTENPQESVLSTPASKSPSAGEPILTPVQQALKELQDATARGTDFQAMINAYTKLGRLTGEDYSAEIADLTNKRQQKIENIDNDYASQIATAMMRGDTEEVARLKAEQSSWRNSVGYQDAMANKYEQARQEIDVDYQTTFWDGIRDIAGMVAQALPGILNFQYDPMQDQNLLRAQSLIEMRARNRMSQTGMYYSSTTQYAISQACANLVPLYQKMAKEEAIQNFQLLQQTASFLVDLEQAQFNLWKGQLDVKFQANADKRAEIAAAWDKVNQLGYVDNETSAILGIPAGTESYATRKAYVDKLNQIDAENRKLQQDKELADYENGLAIQRMERQQELDMEEYRDKAYTDYVYDSELSAQNYRQNVNLENVKSQNNMNEAANEAYYKYLFGNGSGAAAAGTLPTDFATKYGAKAYNNANEYIDNFDINGQNFEQVDVSGDNQWVADEMVAGINDYAVKGDNPLGGETAENQTEVNDMTKMVLGQKAEALINNNSKLFYGKREADTAEGLNNSMTGIHNLVNAMSNQGTDENTRNELALAMYKTLFQSIIEYGGEEGSNDFDYNSKARTTNDVVNIKGLMDATGAKAIFQQGNKAKEDAMIAIINDIYAYDDYPYELKNTLVKQLSNDAWEFARTHDGGYSGLTKKGNWSLINGFKEPEKKTGITPEEFIANRRKEATKVGTDNSYAGDRM